MRGMCADAIGAAFVRLCSVRSRPAWSDPAHPHTLPRAPPNPLCWPRSGGWKAEADWAQTLSIGEQQRVAFARLLYHRPGLAFLDEATSGLDAATEDALYTALAATGASFVSVGAWGSRGSCVEVKGTPGQKWMG